MAHVMGLDLSIRATGVAAPAGEWFGTIKPKTEGDARLVEITDQVMDLVGLYDPALVVIEDLPHGARNNAAGPLGMLHGAVRLMLMRHGMHYVTVTPATLKTYATGRGNAQKPDMRMELYKRAQLDLADDNQVDAMWLRLLGYELLGEAKLSLPQSHLRALAKLPVRKVQDHLFMKGAG